MHHNNQRRKLLLLKVVWSVCSLLFAFFLVSALSSHAASPRTPPTPFGGAGDWSRYMYSDAHQGNNPNETILSTANAASLKVKWTFTGSNRFAGEPIIVNGVIYEGAWDGNMYAIDAATGTQLWVTPLGRYASAKCPPRGISGSAAVEGGLVYIGDGPNFYALSASDGSIVWQKALGPTNDTFIWEAASLANNRIYIGTSSHCDNPLTQGMLYALDPLTGHTLAQASMVPAGKLGGGIWDSPTIDANTGTIIVTTGSTDYGKPIQMTVSVVTLDWNTLAVKQHWQIPTSQMIADADFGSSPTLFPGPNGKTYFGCINKNSIYYVFDEANVSAGPVWEVQLGPGGQKGGIDGSVASSAYVNGVLFIPTVLATVNGTSYAGSIGAFDAQTGRQLWRFGTVGPIVAAVITANGLLFDGQGKTFEVRDQSTGSVLFSYTVGNIKGSITVLNGVVYLPSFNDHIYTLAPS